MRMTRARITIKGGGKTKALKYLGDLCFRIQRLFVRLGAIFMTFMCACAFCRESVSMVQDHRLFCWNLN